MSNTMTLTLRHAPQHKQAAPAAIKTDTLPKQDNETWQKRTYAISRYETYRMGSKSWDCHTCGEQAFKLFHTAISFLSPRGSSLSDNVILSCRQARCMNKAETKANDFGRTGKADSKPVCCENCGSRSRLRLCGACTFSQSVRHGVRIGIAGRRRRIRHARSESAQVTG